MQVAERKKFRYAEVACQDNIGQEHIQNTDSNTIWYEYQNIGKEY